MPFFLKILFIVICLVNSGCTSLTKKFLKDPEIKILDLSVSQFSSNEIELNLKLNVQNPNSIDLNIGKIKYGLKMSGQSVTEGLLEKGLIVPAHASSDVVVPLKFKYNEIGNLLISFLNKTITQDYELNGSVDMGWLTIPFNQKGKIQIRK